MSVLIACINGKNTYNLNLSVLYTDKYTIQQERPPRIARCISNGDVSMYHLNVAPGYSVLLVKLSTLD